MENKGNLVRVSGLSIGRHVDRFEYDNDFLRRIDDFGVKGGHVDVDVIFERGETGADISFDINGNVIVECDRCGDDMSFNVKNSDKMPVKMLGSEGVDGTEDIIYIRKEDNFIDIDSYVEELVKLSLPMKIVHEDENDCNQEAVKLLRGSQPVQNMSHWDALKKLK